MTGEGGPAPGRSRVAWRNRQAGPPLSSELQRSGSIYAYVYNIYIYIYIYNGHKGDNVSEPSELHVQALPKGSESIKNKKPAKSVPSEPCTRSAGA